jgi:hypothetical protein
LRPAGDLSLPHSAEQTDDDQELAVRVLLVRARETELQQQIGDSPSRYELRPLRASPAGWEGRSEMTGKSEFSEQEWELLREGPVAAGMFAASASSGGTFRESWALAKAFAEARQEHGESELLDALVAEKPHAKRYGSHEELEAHGLGRLREAVGLLEQKATSDEVDAYRRFTLGIAERVAAAHKEAGAAVSADELQAIDKIAAIVNPG